VKSFYDMRVASAYTHTAIALSKTRNTHAMWNFAVRMRLKCLFIVYILMQRRPI